MLISMWEKNNYMCFFQLDMTFNSSCWQIDIVFTKERICTLTNIINVNPMQVDLFPWSYGTQIFLAFDAAQAKERSFRNWHPIDQFFPITIEVFGYLHKHANAFLHDCANAIWSLGQFSS
jgi:hypothetical protein